MIGIYFSGTGNTKHAVEMFTGLIDKNSISIPLESKESKEYIKKEEELIVFGYPVQYSNCPFFVRDYIKRNEEIFKNKNIFIIATMGLFSGDGAGCSARLFKKCGANIVGALHLRMPDSVCDVKALKKSREDNITLITEAESKIKEAADAYLKGQATQEGLSLFSHLAGLFGQRLWFYFKTTGYSKKLKINEDSCIKCDKCVSLCPTNNLTMENKKVIIKDKCTMCYRCISNCPKKAITLLGEKVVDQYSYSNIDKFRKNN